MKIYTRGGDKGRTSLFTGGRVDKDDARIEALGALDELVAVLGIARAMPEADAEAAQAIEARQTELYRAMADIAGGSGGLPEDAATALEAGIDAMDAELPALSEFIIPGASPLSAALHHARTVCRRAERRVRAAARDHAVPEALAAYLNRLSDWLFTLARWVDRAGADAPRTFKERL